MPRRPAIPLALLLAGLLFTVPVSARDKEKKQPPPSLEDLLQTKISTASRYEQSIQNAAASVSIITAEDIALFQYRTLSELLMHVPGFYLSDDRNYAYLGVAGFSRPTDYNNRILLQVNGLSLNENVYGSAPVGSELALNLDSIERIEIIRGPSSSLYGTGAMLAVINIVTKTGLQLHGGGIGLEAGSYGRRRLDFAVGGGTPEKWNFSLSGAWADIDGRDLYFEEYDEPATHHGIAENLDWDKPRSFQARIQYRNLSLQGIYFTREKGIPTGSYETVFNDPRSKTLDRQLSLELKYELDPAADKHFLLRTFYFRNWYQGWYPYETLWVDSSDGEWWGGEFQFRWDPSPSTRIIAGVEAQDHSRVEYRYYDEADTRYRGAYPFSVLSLYFQDEFRFSPRLSLLAGIRLDCYSDVGESANPRAGLVWHAAKDGTLKILYGSAFRRPSAYETHYDDPEGGYKDNPGLKPEKIQTVECVWSQKLAAGVTADFSLFSYGMRDLVDQRLDPSDELIQYQNRSRVSALGAGVALNFRLNNGIRGYASYAYRNARDEDLDSRLSNSPVHAVKAGASIPLPAGWRGGFQMLFESSRITIYRTETDPYLLLNANLSAPKLFNHVDFSLQVNNLLNTEYGYPGGLEHLQPAILQDGRNLMLRASVFF
jgi:iron complex outermembrane receptor protein